MCGRILGKLDINVLLPLLRLSDNKRSAAFRQFLSAAFRLQQIIHDFPHLLLSIIGWEVWRITGGVKNYP